MDYITLGIEPGKIGHARGAYAASLIKKKIPKLGIHLVSLKELVSKEQVSKEQVSKEQVSKEQVSKEQVSKELVSEDGAYILNQDIFQQVDAVVLSGTSYIQLCTANETKCGRNDDTEIAAVLHRMSSENVLITSKKNKYDMMQAHAEAITKAEQLQSTSVYEGATCDIAKKGIVGELNRLKENQCNGLIAPNDVLQLLRLNKYFGFHYQVIHHKNMIPEAGQGHLVVLAKKESTALEILKRANSTKAQRELEMEQELFTLVHAICKQCAHEPEGKRGGEKLDPESICTHACIEKGNLTLGVYVKLMATTPRSLEKESIRISREGTLETKKKLIDELIDEIHAFVEY